MWCRDSGALTMLLSSLMTRTLTRTACRARRQGKVAENTPAGSAIGDPVVAEDEDGDILTYTLTGKTLLTST